MASTTPVIILVHGFWGGAAHWGNVITALTAKGYTLDDLHAIDVPLTSLSDDAGRITKAIDQASKGGRPVLLVGHSYGGAVVTEAGNHAAVKGIVYIAAFAPDAGESPGGITQENSPAAAANLAPDSDGFLWVVPDKYHTSFCQDLDARDATVMAVTQKAPLASTFGNTVSDPAWRHKPTWYQVSADDRMIHPDNERRMAKRMNPRKTIELAASHASLASQPDAVAALIDEAAKSLAA
jgi:pimeloyl-ACP methyl ester carboxylesterase